MKTSGSKPVGLRPFGVGEAKNYLKEPSQNEP